MPPSRNLPVEPKLATRAAYAAYDAAGVLAALLSVPALPFLLLRGHGHGAAERLGRLPRPARQLRAPVWIHAASVGEVRSAAAARRGAAPASARDADPRLDDDRHRARSGARPISAPTPSPCSPWTPCASSIGPCGGCDRAALILVELELWPGLLRAAHRRERSRRGGERTALRALPAALSPGGGAVSRRRRPRLRLRHADRGGRRPRRGARCGAGPRAGHGQPQGGCRPPRRPRRRRSAGSTGAAS